MGDLTENFSRAEFACKCGCEEKLILKLGFVNRLQNVRDCYGPMTINSGFRCEKHNKEVGGKPTSSHLVGRAADIACPNSFERFRLIRCLIEAGFTRIGLGSDFVHADADPFKPGKVMWLYS